MNKTFLVCALALAAGSPALAAEIVPVNMDGPNVGLNDPTPAAAVGGNPGTTVGEQRRIVYQFAADLWGAVLLSDAEIRVEASFVPLSCTATAGTLGSAGTKTVFRDFTGAPLLGTWYHSALANAIVGSDLSPDNDIRSRFNANLGTPGCLQASGWYYGLDGQTPAGRINFLDVVMHEIGHGLGFAGFDNLSTGALFAGFPNVYGTHVFDNASGLAWNAMTDAQRVTAAKADALVWTGAEVTDQVPVALNPLQRLAVTGTLSTSYAINPATYGVPGSAANFDGDVVLVNDGAGVSPTDACEPMAAGSLTGMVALADRGNCTFKTKTLNAQNAGATAVIVANNVASGFPGMGDDTTIVTPITIPSVGITQADGDAIKAALPGVHAALFVVPGSFTGSDANSRARLYAPAVLAPGSSFSHYDVTHVPNAIMEPAINSDLDANLRLDLTPALYTDEGWSLNPGSARIGNCTTNVDVVEEGGLIVGANVQAWSNMCQASTPDKATYQNCMEAYKDSAVASGVLTGNQAGKVMACAAKVNK